MLRELSGGTLTLLFSKHNIVHTYLATYLYKQYETVPHPTAFFKLRVLGYSRCDVQTEKPYIWRCAVVSR